MVLIPNGYEQAVALFSFMTTEFILKWFCSGVKQYIQWHNTKTKHLAVMEYNTFILHVLTWDKVLLLRFCPLLNCVILEGIQFWFVSSWCSYIMMASWRGPLHYDWGLVVFTWFMMVKQGKGHSSYLPMNEFNFGLFLWCIFHWSCSVTTLCIIWFVSFAE